jgi:hypothetical protein
MSQRARTRGGRLVLPYLEKLHRILDQAERSLDAREQGDAQLEASRKAKAAEALDVGAQQLHAIVNRVERREVARARERLARLQRRLGPAPR